MLDAKELAKRVRAAMDLREPPLSQVDLADKCGVSKQAVYEWRTTGRMGKGHLITVAQETGMPLEFFLEADRGTTPDTRAIWRRLGKAFAKAAMIVLVASAGLLPPRPALASEFCAVRDQLCIMLNPMRFLRSIVRFLTFAMRLPASAHAY